MAWRHQASGVVRALAGLWARSTDRGDIRMPANVATDISKIGQVASPLRALTWVS